MKEKIHTWLDQIEKEVRIPQYIIVLNFGLYDTERGYCIYLVGASEYDETNDGWADDVENLPHEFFLEIETQCDWKEFQAQVRGILADEIKLRTANTSSPFYNKIITTGFDDGELIRIV